jgi:hypothetical protein
MMNRSEESERFFKFDMKTLLKYFLAFFLFLSVNTNAQVSVNVNIGAPPPWGPPMGNVEVRYYYLPDIEIYYDLHTANYIYFYGGRWVYSEILPVRYAHYDLYGGYKVLVHNYYGPKPFIYFKNHKVKYPKGYKGPPPGQIKKGGGNLYNGPHPSHGGGNNKGSKGHGGGKGHGGKKGKH